MNLYHLLISQTPRKEIYFLDSNTLPHQILTAAQVLQNMFPDVYFFNAILKRYSVVDDPSSAFHFHLDPEEYHPDLFIYSICGFAKLEIVSFDSGESCVVECVPNSMAIVPSKNLHRVSPPHPQYGDRGMLFFGGRENI